MRANVPFPPFRTSRRGAAYLAWVVFLGSIVALGGLIALLVWTPKQQYTTSGDKPLVVYCAAGLKTPVEAIAREYQDKYGVQVQLNYGPSQTLLANIELSDIGDLYLPADESYIQMARDKKLLAETIPVALMHPVLAVAKGNPQQVQSLDGLLDGKLKIAQANPDAAAIGKATRDALQKSGHWDRLHERTEVFKTTVTDVANDIKVGTVDAGFVWDALVRQMPDLEAVPLDELKAASAHIAVSVLKSTTQPTAALRFARYLAARDKGLQAFKKSGFEPVEGDAWAETPQLKLAAGAMLRPAVEETLKQFREREGVEVVTVYNGCGILVGQMLTGEVPDAYFACDKSFMSQVHDLFLDSEDISLNQLVILVPKSNPHEIRSLRDLAKEGIKLGVGHEQQCALGALTQKTLIEGGYYDAVRKNVVVQTPTGDMLVNQLQAGSLDAVVVYVSNAAAAGDKLTAYKIDGIPCAIAIQPIAISKQSEQKQLAGRLLEAIRSAESEERFRSFGFQWQAKK